MRSTKDILGIPVDNVTMKEAVDRLKEFIKEDGFHSIYTPNAEIMMEAYHDPHLANILKNADMIIPDGAGVVLASKILGKSLPEKVPGFDLVKNSFSIDIDRKIRYFFFGGKPGVAEEAAQKLLATYQEIEIVGIRDGYFKPENIDEIISQINNSEPDILLVALGAPKQEKWIFENSNKLKVRVAIGVGGSLDVFAGKVELAPAFFRNNGLEWLYRLHKEPWRYKRMLRLPQYIILVIWKKIFGNV
jgi:N-acetylglucosaminyldiphosphoundecaprenol N-acetyl-beta-D-mannosaminyltransferase